MSEKERLWKLAVKHGLVKGKIGCVKYRTTSTVKLDKLLNQYELEKLKPRTEVIKAPKQEPVNVLLQEENKRLLDKIERQEHQMRALQAENSMLTQKLDRVYNRLADEERVIDREGMLGMITPSNKENNGPMVLVEVSESCHTFGYDGHAYISGQKLKVPKSMLPTSDLILLEDAKEQ